MNQLREREIHVVVLEVPMGKRDRGWSLRDINTRIYIRDTETLETLGVQ